MSTKTESIPRFIATWAATIRQLGLTTPAILLLELHKPLSFTLGQCVLVGQPVLNIFLPPRLTVNAVSLLSNRAYLDGLIKELEQS
ncbi:MAG: hypothetical protein ACE5G8_10625 [Anaerolineae bacterium]